MRNRPANWMIAALLMLQLTFGLQWQVAHAVVVSEPGHCPGHAGASTSAPSSQHNPADKHDCCRSQGCQCHCAQTPVTLDLPWTGAVAALPLLPVFDAWRPVAPTTELFRPPIA
jgi:hypothetical protein